MRSHLTREERKTIDYCIRLSWNNREIAQRLQRNESIISREIRRNGGRENYSYGKSEKRYLSLRKQSKKTQIKLYKGSQLAKEVEKHIKKHYSPDQISGWLRRRKNLKISHETIYKWVYEERTDLKPFLRCQKGKWRKRRGTRKREKKRRMNQFKCIDTRPKEVETRERLGDWEGDTVIGKSRKTRILTYVDRKSGYACAEVLTKVSAEIVQEKTKEIFQKIPKKKRLTITFDRGSEFGGDDRDIENKTKTTVYRAHAYHSWERGTNENWNGLLREFFPKGTEFDILCKKKLSWAVRNINHRPRKRLNYYTPYEVFVLGLDPKLASHD